MGFRVNAGFFLGSLSILQDLKNANEEPTMPTGIDTSTPADQSLLRTTYSLAPRTISLNQTLSGAITLKSLRAPGTGSLLSIPSVFQSSRHILFGAALESSSPSGGIPNFTTASELQQREFSTPGFGDRTVGVTNTAPTETPFLFDGTPPNPADLLTTNVVNVQPTQQDALQVRDALAYFTRQFVLTDPNPQLSDIQSAIDNEFGTGTSALFNVHLLDNGNGTSSVQFDQIQVNELDQSQQQILETASANASNNFVAPQENISLTGSDMNQALNQISNILGPFGSVAVEQLRQSLSQPNSIGDALNQVASVGMELGLNPGTLGQLNSLLQSIGSAAGAVQNSFDRNALVDDLSVTFTSDRYGNAFGTADIIKKADLTNDELTTGYPNMWKPPET